MIILGVNDSHNASACILQDGKIKSAIQEERLSRIKNQSGMPKLAIDTVLRLAGITANEIDCIAIMGNKHTKYKGGKEKSLKKYGGSHTLRKQIRATPVNSLYRLYNKTKRLNQIVNLGFAREKVIFVDHHLCHAAAAYWGCPWKDDKVLVLTCDGMGDDICATVNIGHRGKITRIASVHDSNSIGHIYAKVTFALGMVPNEHEYKVMGLAPYASAEAVQKGLKLFTDLFEFDLNDGMTWHRKKRIPDVRYNYNFIKQLIERIRFDYIAAGIQKFIEDFLVNWVKNCIEATGIRKIALSGGVFMNVKANKRISELDCVEKMFIFPSCGDETNSIGAAYHLYFDYLSEHERQDKLSIYLKDLYWGPAYSETDIEAPLEKCRHKDIKVTREPNIEEKIAILLSNSNVVARFAGRMEFGARALGNRSILADPTKTHVVREINDMIKNRDFWMPFAPSILDRRADDYIINPKQVQGPYMIMSFDTTEKAEEIEAAIHPYDRTVRPQVVYKDWNPSYYRLIEYFEELTGRSAILNTSFNLHGYPIVCTPMDAIDVFINSGLKYLALENYLIEKGQT